MPSAWGEGGSPAGCRTPVIAPAEQIARPVEHLPLVGKHYRRSDYVPPVSLRNPAIPNPVPRNIAHDVKVYVNPSGKADYFEVLAKIQGQTAISPLRRCSQRNDGSLFQRMPGTDRYRVR